MSDLSLKCKIYGDQAHAPCSGTTDDGREAPCECRCHQAASGGFINPGALKRETMADKPGTYLHPDVLASVMDAVWGRRGMEVTEEGEQCIDCLRFGYDPHQDVCMLCGRGQLRPDSDDDDSMADMIPDDWSGEAMT